MTAATSSPLRIAVVGAGAVGGFFAARLAEAGHHMHVLARGATLEAIHRNGGVVLETEGRRFTAPVKASNDPAALGVQDIVIVAVKAPALPQAAASLPPLLDRHTLVLPILNGIPWWYFLGASGPFAGHALRSADPDGSLAQRIPINQVLASVVYPSFSCPEPGVVVHASGARFVFGEPGGGISARAQSVVAMLQEAGLTGTELATDARREVWLKLLGNACFNPVSLLTGSHTDNLIDDPRVNKLFTGMMQELLALGRAIGIHADIEPAARLASTRKLGHIRTSMLQDMEAARTVEIDGILGAAVEVGALAGVATPLLDTVYALARRRSEVLGLYR